MRFKVLAPEIKNEKTLCRQHVMLPFSDVVLEFINTISNRILRNNVFRRYKELSAMAFWMRKANIQKLKGTFEEQKDDRVWLGRGIVFHIAPSNVDTIFIYSWFISMLVGNINIIRISSNLSEQLKVLIAEIREVANREEFSEVKKRFMIVQYEHNEEITSYFSSLCNMRVIWGGDETINKIRAIPIGPTCTELTFADKSSFCIMNAEMFLAADKKEILVDNFYNDAYWFGQNACSSPRFVVWIGNDLIIDKARSLFWRMLEEKVVDKETEYIPALSMDKFVAECSIAISSVGNIVFEKSGTSLLRRILVESPKDIKRELHCGGGLFYEIKVNDLSRVADLVSPKDQTISVFGLRSDELRNFVIDNNIKGIDRFVPIGESLNFSIVWDGYDLLREFCREIYISV